MSEEKKKIYNPITGKRMIGVTLNPLNSKEWDSFKVERWLCDDVEEED